MGDIHTDIKVVLSGSDGAWSYDLTVNAQGGTWYDRSFYYATQQLAEAAALDTLGRLAAIHHPFTYEPNRST